MMLATALQVGDYAALGGMMAGITTVSLTLTVFIVKGLSRRVDAVETDVKNLRDKKADKVEWAREVVLTRAKLDRMSEKMERIDGKLDNNFGIAASITRLSDEFGKWRESSHAK